VLNEQLGRGKRRIVERLKIKTSKSTDFSLTSLFFYLLQIDDEKSTTQKDTKA